MLRRVEKILKDFLDEVFEGKTGIKTSSQGEIINFDLRRIRFFDESYIMMDPYGDYIYGSKIEDDNTDDTTLTIGVISVLSNVE